MKVLWFSVGNDRGNNFGRGRGIAPAPAGARAGVYTMLLLCLEYIAKQATRILTPHGNAANGVT